MKQRILFSLTLIAIISTGYAQKLAPVKGQKIELVATTKMNMEVMGSAVVNESVSTSQVEVKDVTADGYLFSNIVKRITIKASQMGQDLSFDSDNKEDMNGEIGQSMKSKIGAEQEVQIDKHGKVSNIKGLESADDKTGGMSGLLNMTNQLTKGAPYPLVIQLPGKAVKQGDSWTDSTGSQSFSTVTVYTLKSVNADGVSVSFEGTVAMKLDMEQNGMQLKMAMTGNNKGESLFDAGTGVLKNNSSALEMNGTMEVSGTNVPMSTTMTATYVAKKM